jgi:hypothetical protein
MTHFTGFPGSGGDATAIHQRTENKTFRGETGGTIDITVIPQTGLQGVTIYGHRRILFPSRMQS